MSPRSSRKPVTRSAARRLARKEERHAPPTLEARIGTIEAFLRSTNFERPATPMEQLTSVEQLTQPTYPRGGSFPASGGALSPKPSTIKTRLEGLIDRAQLLVHRLDSLDHIVAGNGGPNEAATATSPFSIPDQLELLESLLYRAIDRMNTLSERF